MACCWVSCCATLCAGKSTLRDSSDHHISCCREAARDTAIGANGCCCSCGGAVKWSPLTCCREVLVLGSCDLLQVHHMPHKCICSGQVQNLRIAACSCGLQLLIEPLPQNANGMLVPGTVLAVSSTCLPALSALRPPASRVCPLQGSAGEALVMSSHVTRVAHALLLQTCSSDPQPSCSR